MDINVFPAREHDAVLRVLRTALNPDGALSATERSFLDTYALICGRDPLRAEPQPIDPREVAIAGAHARKRLVQLSALAVLLSRPVRASSLAFLKSLATSLSTHDAVIDVIDALARGRHLKVRLLAMRRVMRVMLKEAYLKEGVMGVLRVPIAMALKAPVNKDKLWGYKKLGLLPEGTLGREYWKHMTEVGFGFPGDVAGIPDSIAYHDVAHVLADNDTTPLGEIQQGSFQGGNRREDGFFFIQMVVLQFHQGVQVTPATGAVTGNFEPDKVLWAIHRGAQCNVDLTHQWNFWPLMKLPLAEARARIGLLPKLDGLAASPLLRRAA
jgi:ubiquinone biosynthesis protein Coq4